jgi:hypothetical protein
VACPRSTFLFIRLLASDSGPGRSARPGPAIPVTPALALPAVPMPFTSGEDSLPNLAMRMLIDKPTVGL